MSRAEQIRGKRASLRPSVMTEADILAVLAPSYAALGGAWNRGAGVWKFQRDGKTVCGAFVYRWITDDIRVQVTDMENVLNAKGFNEKRNKYEFTSNPRAAVDKVIEILGAYDERRIHD